MSITKQMLVLAVGLSGAVGCAGSGAPPIHIVRQHATGGEIALTGPTVAAHDAAEDAMVAHCQGRARILSITPGADDARGAGQAKVDGDAVDPRAERFHYECVSRARALAGR